MMIAVAIAVGALLIGLVILLISGKFSFECKHKNLTPVQEDGRQYCTVCNRAFVPACPHRWELFGKDKQKCANCGELKMLDEGPCRHKWVEKGVSEITSTIHGGALDRIYTLRCTECGELKDFRTGVSSPKQGD